MSLQYRYSINHDLTRLINTWTWFLSIYSWLPLFFFSFFFHLTWILSLLNIIARESLLLKYLEIKSAGSQMNLPTCIYLNYRSFCIREICKSNINSAVTLFKAAHYYILYAPLLHLHLQLAVAQTEDILSRDEYNN